MGNVIALNETANVDSTTTNIIFTNNGEIDIRAVKTMGLSAKENENAIGYFGTGLKYAIAVLLRENQNITIYSGAEKYIFKKKQIDFRGQGFDIITMNDDELPFTTELGKNWELWQAYRELHCNCTDEYGDITASNYDVEPLEGKTIIVCSGDKIEDCYSKRGTIILDAIPLFTSANVEVINGSTHNLFYKNIRVADVKHCLYTYNLKSSVTLTEDRTIKYVWSARGKIMNAVLESKDKDFIKTILLASQGSFEYDFNFTDTSEATSTPSKEFLDVAGEMHRKSRGNLSAHEIFKKHTRSLNANRKKSKLTANQKRVLEQAKKLAESLGYVDNYEVIVTPDMEMHTLGLAEDNKIYINIRCFDRGVRDVTHSLWEEFLHLETGMSDESRELQNFLFEKVISLAAEIEQMAV